MSEKEVVNHFFDNAQDELTISIKILMKCKSKTRKARKKLLNIKCLNSSNISYLITQFGFDVCHSLRNITVDSIIELFYFCKTLAEKCKKQKCQNYIPLIRESLINFLSFHLKTWIKDNNVWENVTVLAKNLHRQHKSNFCTDLILLLL